MRNRRQHRRICMRSIAVFLIAAMLCTGLPVMPVMATETQSIQSEDSVQKDTLSTQEPRNNEEETDPSEETNPPGDTDPSGDENPSGDTDPSEETDSPEETDPSKEENPSGETEPSEEENPSGETEPSEDEMPSGETDLSEEEIPEETVSGNDIIQSDIMISVDEADDSMYRPPYLPLIEPIELPEYGVPGSVQTYINDHANLESTYDSRNEGILSDIRNQNPWGTCWAFATLGTMETSLRKQGLGSYDLSERHLAYFTYHTRSDALGNASGDTIEPMYATPAYLDYGGNTMTAVSALMNWQGAADESKYPYSNDYNTPADMAQAVSQDTAVILKDCYLLNTKANDEETISSVKALVKQYGSVMWSYYDDTPYYNSTTHAYYNNVTNNTNHAIMIVGWNDNYPKENFNTPPTKDGAWIVRNSWSEYWGEKGYFYISYEDTSLGSGNPAAVMVAGLRDEYDNNYFNSNTLTYGWYGYTGGMLKMAQVYTIKGENSDTEQLSAVSFLSGGIDTDYSIQIYKNPLKENGVVENPESGTPLLSTPVTGRSTYQGLYTIDLTEPVIVEQGEDIAIVITFPNGGYLFIEEGSSNSYSCYSRNELKKGESFYGSGYTYRDMADYGYSLRINALTKDVATSDEPILTVENVTVKDFDGNSVVQLKWNSCANAKSYTVLRSESETGPYTEIENLQSHEHRYQDSSVKVGDTYYYKVRVVFDDGGNKESEAVKAEITGAVKVSDMNAVISNMKVLLSWGAVEGAAGYEIYRKAPGESEYSLLDNLKNAPSVTAPYVDDLSGSALGEYEYKMRAYDAKGTYTDWSASARVSFEFKAQQTKYNKIKFTWSKYQGASKYGLCLVTQNGTEGWIINSTTSEQDMTNWLKNIKTPEEFKVGKDYTFYLVALDSNDRGLYVYPLLTYQTTPDELSFTSASYNEGEGVNLQWKDGAGAEKIEIYRSTTPERPGTPYATVDAKENSYTDEVVVNNTTYYYWLCPIVNVPPIVRGAVTDSREITVSISPVAITTLRAVDENSLQVIWEDVPEAEKYTLYRSESAFDEYTKVAENITRTDNKGGILDYKDDMFFYTDTVPVTGKTYYYKVKVFKNGLDSNLELTRAASGHTKPDMPKVVRATHDTITIQNNPSYEYAISKTYQAASALSYTYSTDTNSTETELTFEGLEPDSTYYIYVRTKQSVTKEEPVYGAALKTTTKIKTELVLSSTDVVISKGNRVDITSSLKPSNMHYTGLQWTAYRADGTAYVTQKTGSIFKVIGSDEKEILRITGNTLSATGESTDKEVYLQAEIDALTAGCHVVVNVPVTGITMGGFKVNEEARNSLDDICVSDVIEVSVFAAPVYNADDAACEWSTSNENVLKIIESTDTSVTLKAEGVGNCVLKARTADGISTEQKITVKKKGNVYGIWLSYRALTEEDFSKVKVALDENGDLKVEGLEAKPEYTLEPGKDSADSIRIYAYAMTNLLIGEDGKVTGVSLQLMQNCSYKSANPLIAEVSEDGVVTAKSPGSTDIFAYDTTGNAVYGSCHIEVTGDKPQEEAKTWPFDKAYKFSAVTSSVSIHSYDVDEKSSAKLRIKDQYGNEYTPQDNAKWFTFTSADPSVCIVDETGEVTPNPEYIPKKNKTVTVTAALKNDLGKRKVTFKVTILAVKQVSSVEILSVSQTGDMQTQDAEVQYVPAPDTVRARYEKNGTMTFSAMAYDRFGEEMTTALQWSVTDTSIATVKLNADKKSVTVTFKKAGRTNLTCQAKDTWKKSASIELVLLDTAVIPSEKQVTVNLCQEMTADNRRLSGDFQLRIPAGADVGTLQIQEIKKGKTALTPQEAVRFSIVDKQNACYSIAIDNTNGYADSIKNNTTYELTVGTTVTGLEEIGDRQETFTVKVKVISKKPSISVASPTIDRIYTQDKNLQALLVIKAPDVVENVRVIGGSEGQINQFDDYISVKKEGGQWYAVLDASKAYQKTSIKGKLALRVSGYEEVICNVTIKTPKKAKAVKQQTIPSIYIDTENFNAGGNNTADITLYNNTDKAVLTQIEVVSYTSPKLIVAAERDGTLKAAVKQNVPYKNGETLTAQLKIMETDNTGNGVWADPVNVTVKVKVYTTTLPKAAIAQKTLTLNKKAQSEQAVTTLKLDQQNASFTPSREWEIYAYNNASKKYDIDVTQNGWQNISLDKESGTLRIGFKQDMADNVMAGSYKFRIMNHVKGHYNIYNDITVKVIDTNPTATVKVSGKLDLVNRENMTLTGKLTMKNAISQVKDVTILQAEETPDDTPKAHPYFKAVYKGSNTFDITLTDAGKKAKLETIKYTLPVIITLEGGGRIETEMSLKPTQSVPKIKAPAAQTVYKYTGQLTKDYNLSQSLPSGVRIAKIQVVKVPEGMGVVTKNGHVLVTLSDTGKKKGSYQVNVNVYFEGEQELIGYPDGKPLSVKITVKVEN